MDTRSYEVKGMSCEHCVASVREEVSEIDGVSRVEVDLASGRVVVSGEQLSDDAVKSAVDDAGYVLTA